MNQKQELKKGRPKLPQDQKNIKTNQIRVSKDLLNKLEILKKIYNINTNSSLIEHIINLELIKFGLKKENDL